VVSNKDCPALAVARESAVPVVSMFDAAHHGSRAERDAAMGAKVQRAGADFVVVAGYTETLDAAFVDLFQDRIISPYPSYLPAFGELDEAIGPALDYGVKLIGMTIHIHAANTLSGGAIIMQDVVPVDIDDTLETLIPRLTDVEMTMMWEVMNGFSCGAITRLGNRVRFDRSLLPAAGSGSAFGDGLGAAQSEC
jgi:phosphoribosylglycinamide formyltransferase-1